MLFSEYLLPFEIASILLLVAVVGSVVMARKRTYIMEPVTDIHYFALSAALLLIGTIGVLDTPEYCCDFNVGRADTERR